MNIKNLINIKKIFAGSTLFIGLLISAQNNINIRMYGNNYTLDVTTLDAVFGDVIVNGTKRTTDYTNTNAGIETVPTTLAGFEGAQVVYVAGNGFNNTYWQALAQTQVDALLAFVKQGGILITGMNSVYIGSGFVVESNKFIGEQLLVPSVNLIAKANTPANPINGAVVNYTVPAYHNGTGPLGLYNDSSTAAYTGTFASTYSNMPSASAVFVNVKPGAGGCTNAQVMEFVAPSYPGDATARAAGINGFAYISGQSGGPLSTVGNINGNTRNDSPANVRLAGLIYDFLYNPAGMATRRAWASIPANVNTSCSPTTSVSECPAGNTTAPSVSSTSVGNCPGTTVNLNNLVTSSPPANTTLVWYTNNTASGTQVSNPTAINTNGTYYAFYKSTTTNGCYSTASSPITVTITSPCPCNVGTAVPVIN